MQEPIKQRGASLEKVANAVNGRLSGNEEIIITDITHDSRQTKPNSLFVAIKGFASDGHKFISQALLNGAASVISESERPSDFTGAWIQVEDARAALAQAAALIQGYPSQELKLVGITGTNGKTTTAYLIASLAESANEKSAMLTTVESRIGSHKEKAERTTPEASDTQRFLRRAVDEGCKMAVMEFSSQAMDLRRCDALDVSVAVFSNLTQDHLDYHKTMEEYFNAKSRLFDGRLGRVPGSSVINVDDAYGVRLTEMLEGTKGRVVRYAIEANADVKADEIKVSLKGTSFLLTTPLGKRKVVSPLVGHPHVYNILASASAAIELGYDFESIVRGVEVCTGAPGRFERVPYDGDFAVIVDYAHTDDALVNVLKTARSIAEGRVITVFGCGGDRDRTKRSPMGEAAASFSDLVILTSDNPRTEDPLQILNDAEAGLQKYATPYQKIVDRREAIFRAIEEADSGDVVLIAGKGHEDYQIIGKDAVHFDDKEVAGEALKTRKIH